MGEMRLRVSKMAGLKKIPAMIKDVDDKGVALQALIENVQRTDLKPIPKAKGLFEYYRLAGNFAASNAAKIKSALRTLEDMGGRELRRGLTDFEKKVKDVADTVGLSYRRQRTLISHIELDPDEQTRVGDLEIESDKIERIAAIDDKIARSQMIEIAPTLNREEFSRTVTVVKNAPEHLKKEVFELDSNITPEIATKILDVKNEEYQKAIVTKVKKEKMPEDRTEKLVNTIKKSTETVKKAILKPKSRIMSEIADTILTLQNEREQGEVIREVEEYRLDEDETKMVVGQIVSYRDKISPPKEEWEKLVEELRRDEAERAAFLKTPDAKRRAKIFRNWLARGNFTRGTRICYVSDLWSRPRKSCMEVP